jgi:hypothetical protein
MKNKNLYLILAAVGLAIWYFMKDSVTSVGVTATNLLSDATSSVTLNTDILISDLPGKPIYSMWPGNGNNLVVRMYTADASSFLVGQSIKLSGSINYHGSFLIIGDAAGVSPYGPVRDLFLNTQFISEEKNATVISG